RRAIRNRRGCAERHLVRALRSVERDRRNKRRLRDADRRAKFSDARFGDTKIAILLQRNVDEPCERRVAQQIQPRERRERVERRQATHGRNGGDACGVRAARRSERIEERTRRVARPRDADSLLRAGDRLWHVPRPGETRRGQDNGNRRDEYSTGARHACSVVGATTASGSAGSRSLPSARPRMIRKKSG